MAERHLPPPLGTATAPAATREKKAGVALRVAVWGGGRYSIGYADCDTPFGPCRKRTTDRAGGPWFGPRYGSVVGPGSNEFFSDAAGARWIVFHGWRRGKAGYAHGGTRTVRFHPLSGMPPLR